MESSIADSGIVTQDQEVNSPLIEMDNSSEIFTRMDINLKECQVLLHRLTEEEIYSWSCHFYNYSNEISDDVKKKTEELLCKTVETEAAYASGLGTQVTYRKDGSRRQMRALKNNSSAVFEHYKKHRQGFLNRRNKMSYSDNSWSQDEARSSIDGLKVKKKVKRGRKYELDYDWSPHNSNSSSQNNRKLRSRARRPVIESESSSSDEEEILLNFYLNGDNDYVPSESAFENSVPSDFNHENITSSFVENAFRDSVSENNSEKYKPCNETQVSVNSGVTLQKSDSFSGDIVSGILSDMDRLKGPVALQTPPTYSNQRKTEVSKRKKFKLVAGDQKYKVVKKEVASLLKSMINKVSSQYKHLDKGNKIDMKHCKWCKTPFPYNKSFEGFCAICHDNKVDKGLGKSCKSSSATRKNLNSKKFQPLKSSKFSNVNKTMTQMLKKLPKNEMQRLMYVDKADKIDSKGYNHCKSFFTPKDFQKSDSYKSSDKNDLQLNKVPKKVNVKGKKIQLKRKNENSVTPNENKSNISTEAKSNKQRKIAVNEDEENQKKKCVSLKKFDDGLFLMTFPDRDEELDILDKTSSESHRVLTNVSSNNLNNGNIVDGVSKNSMSKRRKLQSSSDKQFDTYLFPPVPTVIVSNYSSDSNSLNLSRTYYQNEITHQHAHKNSTTSFKSTIAEKQSLNNNTTSTKSLTVSVSNNVSYQSPTLSTSSLMPKNTSVTITTIPINESLQHMQSFSVPILNSETSVARNVTLMPVISTVMSLPGISTIHTNTANVPSSTNLFSLSNFNNLQITMTKVPAQNNDSFGLSSDVLISANSKINILNKQAENNKSSEISTQRKALECSETSERDMGNLENVTESDPHIATKSDNSNKSPSTATSLLEDALKSRKDTDDPKDQSVDYSTSNKLKENIRSQNGFPSIIDELDAVSILAVVDLEKNPHTALNARIKVTKVQFTKLTNENKMTPDENKRLSDEIQLLNIAKQYLNVYGSFAKVCDFLLRRAQMIQIKKELVEGENQSSSCMFSQSSQLNNSLSESDSFLDTTKSTDVSNTTTTTTTTTTNVNNFNSCNLSNQASINHIEKIQSQIAAMNNVELTHYSLLQSGGTIHHFPTEQQISGLPPAVVAPTPITPHCVIGESRETPSRGSGPRTPARPESAASQSEEQNLIQIKKEQFEAASSPSAQCAFSQNTTLPQISSQLPLLHEMPSLNMPAHSVSNTTINLPVSNSNQTNLHLQSRELVPNRTVTYNNNQNYSDVLLNITTKPVTMSPVVSNQQINQNRQVLLGQQMFIQNGSGLCQKQAVPSVNTNQYVIRPPFTSTNTGGTVIVNNPQVGQNALLTNVSNQQFYTSNQVSQLYYPPSSQITCMPSSNISTAPDAAATQIQQVELPEQMLCAVCNSQATLRCKQCARVAYCNTTCAKTYWHQKHKMECKPLGS